MGAEYGRKPVGSGPYMVENFIGGEGFRLVPNPSYSGDYPATLKAIDFTVVPEDGSRMALLETGSADVVERVPPESMPAINASEERQGHQPAQHVLHQHGNGAARAARRCDACARR